MWEVCELVSVGDTIRLSKLNGREVDDVGIVVEVFDSSFFYYSIDELDLNRKIHTVKIDGKNLDAYEVIKRDVKEPEYILNELKRWLNKEVRELKRELEVEKDDEVITAKYKVYEDIMTKLNECGNNYSEVRKGIKNNKGNIFNKKGMR